MAEKRETREERRKVGFVFPVDVTENMRRLAKSHNRSLVGEIVWALREYINRHDQDANQRPS